MPFIPFPDVPIAPGVPNINRAAIGAGAATGLLQKLQRFDMFGIEQMMFGSVWSIVDDGGNSVIQPDTVLEFDYRNERHIASHPVEQGTFTNYNKTAVPFDIHIRMACNGQGKMSRDKFLAQIESMLNDTKLYSVVTPDATYLNCNLVHYDYRRESKGGVSMIIADIALKEIREAGASKQVKTKTPASSPLSKLGTVLSNIPTKDQIASFVTGKIL